MSLQLLIFFLHRADLKAAYSHFGGIGSWGKKILEVCMVEERVWGLMIDWIRRRSDG